MNIKHWLTITALLSLANGLFYFFFPAWSLSLLGATTDSVGLIKTQFFGAAALGMAAMAWFGRAFPWQYQRVIVLGYMITLSAAAIAGFQGTLAGEFNFLGWVQVGIDTILSAGFLFALIFKQGTE